MAGKGLVYYAQEHNLTVLKDKVYGFYRNYLVTVGEKGKGIKYYTAVFAQNENVRDCLAELMELKQIKGVQSVAPAYRGVTVTYAENAGKWDITEKVGDTIVSKLAEKGVNGAGYCPCCGEKAETGTTVEIFGNVYIVHENCLLDIEEANERAKAEAENKGSILFGFIGAFIGALVGIIPWMLVDIAGYFSAWLGLLAATCSKFGYEKLKGKNTYFKSIAVAISTVIAVIIETLTVYTLQIMDAFSCDFMEALDLNIRNLLFNGEYLGNVILNLVLALVFAGIGVAVAISNINSELPGNKGKIKRI